MNPHQFLFERWENDPTQVTLEVSRESDLSEAVEAFERFLIAVGYSLPENSHLDFVENDQ